MHRLKSTNIEDDRIRPKVRSLRNAGRPLGPERLKVLPKARIKASRRLSSTTKLWNCGTGGHAQYVRVQPQERCSSRVGEEGPADYCEKERKEEESGKMEMRKHCASARRTVAPSMAPSPVPLSAYKCQSQTPRWRKNSGKTQLRAPR